jgi:hypothetical protein
MEMIVNLLDLEMMETSILHFPLFRMLDPLVQQTYQQEEASPDFDQVSSMIGRTLNGEYM